MGIQSLVDRYTYVPLIGIFIVLTWGSGALLTHWRWPRFIIGLTALLLLGACAIRTTLQLQYWRNTESLFQHTLAITKNNWMAYSTLGAYMETKGRLAEAMEDYRKALQINPDNGYLLNGCGSVLLKQNRTAEAM